MRSSVSTKCARKNEVKTEVRKARFFVRENFLKISRAKNAP